MISRQVMIQNRLGLHARSASAFVKTASAFGACVEVRSPHATANGKSIMSMLMLQAAIGTEIELIVDGADEEAAIDALVALINARFGEAE